MTVNRKYNFQKGEEFVLVNGEIGEVDMIYLKPNYKETKIYYLSIEMYNGDNYELPFSDEWEEKDYREIGLYNLVHKIGDRGFGKLLTEEEIEKQKEQYKVDGVCYVEGKSANET
jgi:hypothetical protein